MFSRKLLLGLLFVFSASVFAYNVSVTDMVDKATGADTDIPLPNVIKADSDWVPLYKINVSTNSAYTLQVVTVTLVEQSASTFDPNVDLLDPDNGLAIFKDADGTWDTTTTSSRCAASYSPSDWTETPAGSNYWVTKLTLSSNNSIASGSNYFFVAVKTADGISNGDQFSAEFDSVGDLVLLISSTTITQNFGAATTLTADTNSPALQEAYNPDPSDGTTSTVENQSGDNVYSVANDNIVSFRVNLGETSAALNPNTRYILNNLIEINSGALIGTSGAATTAFAYIGANIFNLNYTITSSTVNENTDGISPIPFRFRIRDAAGNWSSWSSDFNVYIDSKNPEGVTLTAPLSNSYVSNNAPELQWDHLSTSQEAHLNVYAIIVATSANFGGNRNIAVVNKDINEDLLPANGGGNWAIDYSLGALTNRVTYYWSLIGVDEADNTTSIQDFVLNARSFVYDGQAPALTWDYPAAGVTLRGGSPVIKAFVGDYGLSGVDSSQVTMKINDGTNDIVVTPTLSYDSGTSSYTVTYTPSVPLHDGSYTIKIDAQDNVENAMVTATRAFNVDSTSPTVVDTDNDGESDIAEKFMGTDWLDPSDNSGSNYLWPLNADVINSATLVGAQNRIAVSIDDPYQSAYVSSADMDASTVTVSGPAGTFVFGVNDTPYVKTTVLDDFNANPYAKFDAFTCQIPIPLATNGSHDGTYTVQIVPEDNAGNIGATVTRTFTYDTIKPTITAVATPASGTTNTSVTFTIQVADQNGISDDVDAVQLLVRDSSFVLLATDNLEESATTPGQYPMTVIVNTAGTYYYYFQADDKAGNTRVYPANANTNKSQAIKLVVTDASGPWAVIGNDNGGALPSRTAAPDSFVKTLVNVPTAGITKEYKMDTAPAVNEVPPVYSAANNILQATIENDAVTATFQYKLSSATTWTSLTTSQTSTNQVWQAAWNTTGLSTGIYDIRITATDSKGNTSTPSSINSPAWVQVELKGALAPTATIDATRNAVKVVDGNRVKDKLVLCASLGAAGNVDIANIAFQYRSASGGSWTDISTDSDPTNNTPVRFTFRLDYDDIPKIIQTENIVVDTATIESVSFDCTTNNTYDTQMNKVGDGWEITIPLVPATYDYEFSIDYADGNFQSVDDPNHQDDGGADSRICITAYTGVWDIS
ncbi:MAG: hypothetical protein ABIH42_00770, partial [Planctomycetota bacterium]